MMKIGIITFHAAHNYGSMLQAYALSRFLTNYGCSVTIINLRTPQQYKMYPFPTDLRVRTVRGLVADIALGIIPVIGKWNKYEQFINKHLPTSRVYSSIDELKQERWDIDMLVVGSDQIWNTECKDWDESYFGNFINNSITKIAYAPSMGRCPEETVDKDLVKRLCHGFDQLSVREPRTADFLRSVGVAQDIDIVLDPTLLLTGEDYEGLLGNKPLVKGDYIFFYDPFRRPAYLRVASMMGEKLGLPVVCDRRYYPPETKGVKNIKYYINVGPSEFLNLIKHSRLVCGHSFHSVVFSILFKKDFYALDGDKDSRMMHLLGQLNLAERAVCMSNPTSYPCNSIQNYDQILDKLNILKKHSVQFLTKNLEKLDSRILAMR